MAQDMKDFYEGYWNWREETEYLYRDAPPFRVRAAVDMLASKQPPPRRVLDLGTGEGSLGKVLKERIPGVEAVGFDISEKAVSLAAAHYDRVTVTNLESDWSHEKAEWLGPQPFDGIVCMEVLEHVFDPAAILEQAVTLLADGGVIVTSFPNFAYVDYRLEVLRGRFPGAQHIYSEVEHFHYFTLQSFLEMHEEVGLKPIAMEGQVEVPRWMHRWLLVRHRFARKRPDLFATQIVVGFAKA